MLSSSRKAAAYKATDDEDELHEDVQNAMRGARIRESVRSLQSHPVLSADWLVVADTLFSLARVCQMDALSPSDSSVGELVGRDSEGGGTLWDQESDESVIRTLVEEAKLNVCLRMLNDYKIWEYQLEDRQASIESSMSSSAMDAHELETKAVNFEHSMGLILNRAFHHVEALQLTDLSCLIDHCAFCLQQCESAGRQPSVNSKAQETLVLVYFSSLMIHLDGLNSNLVLQRCQETNLLHLVLRQTVRSSDQLPAYVLAKVCSGLSSLADNEDFQVTWKDFFREDGDGSQKASFFAFDEQIVADVLNSYPEKRRELRPFSEFVATLRKS